MVARDPAILAMPMMLSVTLPSSLLAKRLRLRRKKRPTKRAPWKMRWRGRLNLMRSLAVRGVVERGTMMTLTAIMMRRKMQMGI